MITEMSWHKDEAQTAVQGSVVWRCETDDLVYRAFNIEGTWALVIEEKANPEAWEAVEKTFPTLHAVKLEAGRRWKALTAAA